MGMKAVKKVMVEEDGLLVPGCIVEISDDIQKGCHNCKHCSKLITEEPCMDCDPRYEGPKNHWEAEE